MIAFKLDKKQQREKQNNLTKVSECFDDSKDVDDATLGARRQHPQTTSWLRPSVGQCSTPSGYSEAEIKPDVNDSAGEEAVPSAVCDNVNSLDASDKIFNSEEEERGKRRKSDSTTTAVKSVKSRRPIGGLVSLGSYTKGARPQHASRYISSLIQTSTRRELEHELVNERQLKREMAEDPQKNQEVFVTGAYKKRLLERQEFEKKLMEQDIKDAINDPRKKKDLTAFHHYMLTSGKAARTQRTPDP